jgi:CobQ-like glutamine amidotransferase family enzyme
MSTIRVGHLYPDYLNIYADRGNIAVLDRRAAWRGHDLEVTALGMNDAVEPGAHDLYYVGGGQDREQMLVADNLAAKAEPLREAVLEGNAALLAVCGGYQLLGRGYRGFHGEDMPGVGLFPLETVAGERRMIGDVLIESKLVPGRTETLAGFENHIGRTRLDPGAEPLGRVVAGFGNDGESGFEGCRVGRAVGTYLHGPLLPRNPWLADWLLAQALAHRSGGEARELEPLPDELEARAHAVSAGRARARGGKR